MSGVISDSQLALQLLRTLRHAGMSNETCFAILDNPDIAEKVVSTAQTSAQTIDYDSEKWRKARELLSTSVDDLGLDRRGANALRLHGLETIGAVALQTEVFVTTLRNIGPITMEGIKKALADRGLEFRDPDTPLVFAALQLYGSLNYIPSMSLVEWATWGGVSDLTLRAFFKEVDTIGQLLEYRESDILEGDASTGHTHAKAHLSKGQLERVKKGLSLFGLELRK